MDHEPSRQTREPRRVVVGVTGASGAVYARRALEVLARSEHELHVVVSAAGLATWAHELGQPFDLSRLGPPARFVVHRHDDLFACITSGSFEHAGMVVVPCSVKTLAKIAHGIADDALTRAADVCLKERRPLVLVVREAPLSLVHIENMAAVTRAGAVVLPASPGFYHRPASIDELVDFVVARALDPIAPGHGLSRPWTGP